MSCTEIDGVHYLSADYSVVCYSTTWLIHLPVAVVGFLLYVLGIPAIVVAVVHRYKDAINDGSDPDHEWAVARFASLCAGYKEVFEYFEARFCCSIATAQTSCVVVRVRSFRCFIRMHSYISTSHRPVCHGSRPLRPSVAQQDT